MTQFQKYFQKFQDIDVPSSKLENFANLTIDDEQRAEELIKLIKTCSNMRYRDAFEKYGPDGLPTIYELASMRELFYNSKNRVKHQKTLDRHLYQLCGEFLTVPPKDHPGYPNVILSKIESVAEKNVVPSKTEYTICENLHVEDNGYITDFKKINGLMVPFIQGRVLWSTYDPSKDNGYGSLIVNSPHVDTDGVVHYQYNPQVHRPCSWTHFSGFHNNDGVEYLGYTAIPRDLIKGFID
jgi:hypothetical protein